MVNHHSQWENSLFLWQFSSSQTVNVITRGYSSTVSSMIHLENFNNSLTWIVRPEKCMISRIHENHHLWWGFFMTRYPWNSHLHGQLLKLLFLPMLFLSQGHPLEHLGPDVLFVVQRHPKKRSEANGRSGRFSGSPSKMVALILFEMVKHLV